MLTLKLTKEEVEILQERTKRTYLHLTKKKLTPNTSEANYVDLSTEIQFKTEHTLKPAWLRDFIGYKSEKVCKTKSKTENINALCHFIHGKSISKEYFFASVGEKVNKLLGNYAIYWTGNVRNHDHITFSKKLDLELTENESIIIDGKDIYMGRAIEQLGDKAYLNFMGEKIEERVFLILHVGNADKNSLEYIPGLFAAGDHSNINPSAGPIMLVRDSVVEDQINEKFLTIFFSSYRGNNLVKSWTISDVLEKLHSTARAEKVEGKNWDPMGVFYGQKFLTYHWKPSEVHKSSIDCIERSILTIGKNTNSVFLESGEGNKFHGTIDFVNPQHLLVKISTDNSNTRILFMLIRIRTDKVPEIATGVYSFIADEGFSTAGIVLFQSYSEKEERSFKPKEFATDEQNPELPNSIRMFLNDRYNNFVKTPASAILDLSALDKFHVEQQRKLRGLPKKQQKSNGIFIATPMSSDEDLFQNLKEIINKIIPKLSSFNNCNVYYAGEKYDPAIGFTHASFAAEQDFKELDKADKVMFIHPKKVASSTLIELGWALAQKKEILIFYRNKADLPFLVRDLNHVPNVRYYQFKDLENLKHIITKSSITIFN